MPDSTSSFAGARTRMKSAVPKVLHRPRAGRSWTTCCGRPRH
jgi:hypothetical protein